MNRFPCLLALGISFLVATDPSAAQQSPAERWKGSIQIPGSPLDVVVALSPGTPSWSGTIDIPAQGAVALPLSEVTIDGALVSFAIGGIPGRPRFTGTISGDTMAGSFAQGGATFPFLLVRARKVSSVSGDPLDSIRAFIREAMPRWNVPGLALAIIRDGEVALAEGFGVRDLLSGQPVTASTVMPIGSSTKAFTAFIIGTLVDKGLVRWDDPVQKHLPEFALEDEVATRTLRVRDLLTHVSGLPRHDLVWYGSNASREELFNSLKHLESSAPIRTDWQYQNLMYMTAGVLAERVTGRRWETLVQEQIFAPLGMSQSHVSIAGLSTAQERATGYRHVKDRTVPMEYRNLDAIGPAGSISSTADDMARWVLLHLNRGSFEGREILSRSVLGEVLSPQVVMPSSSSQPGGTGTLLFNLYAMGWMEHSYRGFRLVEHGGNIDGFSALVSFMPEKGIGVVVLTNMNGCGLPGVAMLTIYDRLLGFDGMDWSASALGNVGLIDTLATESRQADEALRVRGTSPSHRLEDYVGVYEHPAYGAFDVRLVGRRLEGSLHGLFGTLEHYHYDVFAFRNEASPIDGVKARFETGSLGEIASVTLPIEPAVGPIRFERRLADGIDSAAASLLVGEYEIAGMTATVTWRAGALILDVTGQGESELLPYMGRTFRIEDAEGYSARFEPAGGRAERLMFIQPNGVFQAKRRK